MLIKNIFINFIIIMLTAFPASAGDVSLNKWVQNIILYDDGSVEEVIQIEINNSGSAPFEGFSFIVPASGITMIYDFDHTSSFTGQVVKQETIPEGTRITVELNRSVDAGSKWNDRVGFKAEKWAVIDGVDYSMDIPVKTPEAIVSGKNSTFTISADPDVRAQVILPRSFELISVQPEPFRKLFQYGRIVPTWTSDGLHMGDIIHIEASFSNILDKIVGVDEKARDLTNKIKIAKAEGKDVSEAEAYLNNLDDYNNNQAIASFGEKKYEKALEYVGYANDEMKKAQDSLSNAGNLPVEETAGTGSNDKIPGFGAPLLLFGLLASVLIRKNLKIKVSSQ